MKKIPHVAENILSHIDIYLDQLNDEDYGRPLPLLSDASIGGHTRHVMDGFLCIMNQRQSGTISYDKRERNRQLETDTRYARQKLSEIKRFIHSLDDCDCMFEIQYEDQTYATRSTITREIVHNIEHVIHHLAIIKIALKAYHSEVSLPEEFGVAPSTLKYWNQHLVKH